MALFFTQLPFSATIFLLFIVIPFSRGSLSAHYYDQNCPQAEKIISEIVHEASMHDPRVPARLLRIFFHDCFIRGCDGSVLLDSTPGNRAEKDGPPNVSLAAFYVIDKAKARLEKACPSTVSCADITAIAARDAVAMHGGPCWDVLKGRKDGRVSMASETEKLPAPSFNVTQLIESFAERGLGVKDLVALSGGHTLGFSHCSSFEGRIRNFSQVNDIDPSMDSQFAERLRQKCPVENKDENAGEILDSTSTTFDNDYYKEIVHRKGLFGSDQALYDDHRSRCIVESFANDQSLFFRDFAASMLNLGNVGVPNIQNGEVRRDCRFVN